MISILTGDALQRLRELPDNSVQACVTSPPYFGLRNYGVDGQIGLEATPDEFVAAIVEVFREVRRVLRPDGTCWLNLGDSYAANKGGAAGDVVGTDGYTRSGRAERQRSSYRGAGLKPKDLLMVPARCAIALQADGWWLRSDIIWAKNNPMPEAVTDRPTSAHEHVFLLTKSEQYFFDAEAVKESTAGTSHPRGKGIHPKASDELGIKQNSSFSAAVTDLVPSRNARNVWNINSAPFRGAHFATFPPELARRCIAASTSECGACAVCAAPFRRVIEKGAPDIELQRRSGGDADGQYGGVSTKDHDAHGIQNASDVKRRILAGMVERRTVDWIPTCRCPDPYPVPCLVLDPFFGAGTTGLVSHQMGRDCLGIELNGAYVDMAAARLRAAGAQVVA